MSQVQDLIKAMGGPLADEMGYELVDVEFLKEGSRWFLRLYLDSETGITLNDCARYSEAIEEEIDSLDQDPIPYAYYLEVSSIGAERPLENERDWERAVGKYIHVTLHEAVDKESIYEGTLTDLGEDAISMDYMVKGKEKSVTIPKDLIAKARLAVKI